MGATGVVILLVSILGANTLALIAALAWLRGRLRRREAELRALVRDGERFLVEPAPGTYRGATDRFGKVKGTGVVALTDRRILCAKAIGALIDVPLAEVADVREEKWFLRSSNGIPNVVLRLRDGIEIGFQVRDRAQWLSTLRAHLRAA